tara:strand:+ start:85 stop:1467 length:1383 start_codon:yes stop_codon:yes gene_type:complete
MAEISEGFCVAACMFKTSVLEEVVKGSKKDLNVLKKFMKEVEKVAKKTNKIKYGSEESSFLAAYKNPNDKKALVNFAQGISGALAIHQWLKQHHSESITPDKWKGYLTGGKWPSDIEKLRIDKYGMKDYNSADLVIYTGKQGSSEYFYGVSLKKKGASLSGKPVADPTLINKAFASVLNSNDQKIKKLLDGIEDDKAIFFSDLVREAAKPGNPLAGSNFNDVERNNLWKENIKEKKKLTSGEIKTRALINIKGKGAVDLSKKSKLIGEGQPKSLYRAQTGDRPWEMRDFVNKRIQGYFSGLEKVLNLYADIFANALINLILKEKLYDELNENETLKNTYFGFALVTGTATITKTNAVIHKGESKELHMVLCALADMNNSKNKYTIKKVPNPKFKGEVPDSEDDAAKVFYDLSKGETTILKLEIRYKGSFTPQPQFQATLSDDFKKLVSGQYMKSNKCMKF